MSKYFSDIHSSAISQFTGKAEDIKDSAEIILLRKDNTFEGLLKLAQALCFQLRYREAIDILSRALALKPDDINTRRLRAARYLNTLQIKEALADFTYCEEHQGDKMDLSYRKGLCYYLLGDYHKSIEEFDICYPLCDDEMGIAAIFWHTLSCWRCGQTAVLLEKEYHPGMSVGHHTSYNFCMALASGKLSLKHMMMLTETEESDLEYSILAYGLHNYLSQTGEADSAETVLKKLLNRDDFWISYAYIAAWNDAAKKQTGI